VHHLEEVLLLCHKHYGTNPSFVLEVPRSGSSDLTWMAALANFFKYPYIRFSQFKCPILGAALNRDMVIVAVWMSNLPRETARCKKPIVV
jgi:hypothetical protein